MLVYQRVSKKAASLQTMPQMPVQAAVRPTTVTAQLGILVVAELDDVS